MKTPFTLMAAMFLINLGQRQPIISNFRPSFGDQIIQVNSICSLLIPKYLTN